MNNTQSFAELIEADGTVRFSTLDVAGEDVVLVNDGEVCWLSTPAEIAVAKDSVEAHASPKDWYSWFCNRTSHRADLVPAFEAEHGVRNWP